MALEVLALGDGGSAGDAKRLQYIYIYITAPNTHDSPLPQLPTSTTVLDLEAATDFLSFVYGGCKMAIGLVRT